MLVAVPEEIEAIAELIRGEAARFDFFLVTGGLGGTPDDMTREALPRVRRAAGGGAELAGDLCARFGPIRLRGAVAVLPRGARRSRSARRRARLPDQNIYVLPGLPSEIEAMFLTIAEDLRRGSRSAHGGASTGARARSRRQSPRRQTLTRTSTSARIRGRRRTDRP